MAALKIESAILTPYELGLDPEAGFGNYRRGFLLRLTLDDGFDSSGDVAPLPGFSREKPADVVEEWSELAQAVRGAELPMFTFDAGGHLDDLLGPIRCASLRFGLEQAMLGLTAHKLGVELKDAIVGEACSNIKTVALVVDDGTPTVAAARHLVDEGYGTLKIKVGRRGVQEDAARVDAIRHDVGPDIDIRVDANRAWSFGEAIDFLDRTAHTGLEFVEEPLADATRLLELWEATGGRIALDETMPGSKVEELDRWAFASHFVLKPTLNGGIRVTERIVRKAISLGIRPVVSSAFESGIGITYLALLAGRWCPDGPPAGLGTHRYLKSDLTTRPLEIGPIVGLAHISPATTYSS